MGSTDFTMMSQAIEEAKKAQKGIVRDPSVGAVVVMPNGEIFRAHRSEIEPGDHAEFTLLHKKRLGSSDFFKGATLYTTLEPCTNGRHEKKMACADWIITMRISRVVIGIVDPNPTICGRGYWKL